MPSIVSSSLRPLRPVFQMLSTALLFISWFVSYLWVMMLTEAWGAPWDTAPIRPPVGHWQRSINDFFESGIGVYLPTAIFLAISLLLYVRALRHTQDLGTTSLVFGITNVVAMLALMVFSIPIQLFLARAPAHLTPADWSYWGDFRREWPLALMAFTLFAVLFAVQPRLVGRLTKAGERIDTSHHDDDGDRHGAPEEP